MWDKVVTWWFMWEIDWLKVYYSNNMQTVSSVKHLLAWQGTPICFAANIKPVIQFITSNLKPDKFTTTVKSQTKFNVKTFIEWTIKLIDVQIVNS
jgi:sulfite reductase alpha subunit-like flavoprotein